MTHKQKYLEAGLKLLPSGRMNNYQWVKLIGRLGSRKDFTWKPDLTDPHRHRGQHTCCGSKRDYYHKISCKVAAGNSSDDLSDLKNI